MTTDERLIIRLCNQEQQSLVELYDRYYLLLWKFRTELLLIMLSVRKSYDKSSKTYGQDLMTLIMKKIISSLLIECCQTKINLISLQKSS
ncbi:hypothetical protein C8K15_11340 [Paenisporosarcina sp. OV554]|nr:hypothetical protein C8K15_11340 [Paenisporosarcina sp. OV554]